MKFSNKTLINLPSKDSYGTNHFWDFNCLFLLLTLCVSVMVSEAKTIPTSFERIDLLEHQNESEGNSLFYVPPVSLAPPLQNFSIPRNVPSNVPSHVSSEHGTFQAGRSFAVGKKPQSIAAGDFNNDGSPDFVVANTFDFSVPVFLNDGKGSFKFSNSYYLLGAPASGVAVGDFNNDDFLDFVVVTARDLSLWVLLGNGDGSFRNPMGPYGTGGRANAVAVGDLNGDGKLDLVTSLYLTNVVSVLLGNGSGLFQQAGTYSVGANPVSVVLGDVNNDTKFDAVIVNQNSDNISVLVGDGFGNLQPMTTIQVGDSPQSVALGHFDSDNFVDLVTANAVSQDYSLILGNGNGTFNTALNRVLGFTATSVTGGDFNFDGKQDIAIAGNRLGVDPATGQGFEHHFIQILSNDGTSTFTNSNQFPVGDNPKSLLSIDFNGDGKNDIASANFNGGTVSVILSNSAGYLSAPNYSVGSKPVWMTKADFNNDDVLDLAVSNSDSNSVSVLIGIGNGTFNAAVNYPVGRLPAGIAAGDINNDGIQDLAVLIKVPGSVAILLGNGDGTFNPNPIIRAIGGNPEAIVITDLNNDGTKDIAIADPSSDYVYTLLGNGDSSFNLASQVRIGCGIRSMAAADLNGDGNIDFAVTSSCLGKVAILIGSGDGLISFANNITINGSPNSVAAGDFDNNGITDIAVVISGGIPKDVSIFLGTGGGEFGSPVTYSIGHENGATPLTVTVEDFNSDGNVDLAITRNYGNDVLILNGTGNGTFLQSDAFVARSSPRSIVSGDFNGDGVQDIAVGNYLSNDVSILLQYRETSDPGTLQFSQAFYDVSEDAGSVTLSVTRSGSADGVVSVQYTIIDGTATSEVDWRHSTPSPAILNWEDGDYSSKEITIQINDDSIYEGTEQFSVTISNPTGGAFLGPTKDAIVYILEDDSPPVFGFQSLGQQEGNTISSNFGIFVIKTGSTAVNATLNYHTVPGTATPGSSCNDPGVDYETTFGTLTFLPHETSKLLQVVVCGGTEPEPDETFSIPFTNPVNGIILPGTGTSNFWIANDDQYEATVRADDKTITYGDPDPVFTYSTVGLQGTDTLTGVSCSVAGEHSAAGTYDINCSGNTFTNYSVTYVVGTLTVNPKPVTVTADDKTVVYGALVPTFTYTTVGLQDNDVLSGVTCSVTSAHNMVGNYPITCSGNVNDNYTATYLPGSLMVTSKEVVVTSDAKTKTYGDPDPTLTFNGALDEGDAFTGSLTREPGENAGTYRITQGTLSAGTNYNIIFIGANLTITKANPNCSISSYAGIYDGGPHGASGSCTGIGGPTDILGGLDLGATFTLVPGGTADWTFTDSTGNYHDANGSVSIAIETSFCFEGFHSPIGGSVENGNGGTFANPVRSFKLGSVIPVKFSLRPFSNCGESQILVGIHKLQAIRYSSNTTSDLPIDATPTDGATTGNQFRLTGDQWHFNLSTKSWTSDFSGTWLLVATLQDGSVHTVWITIKR